MPGGGVIGSNGPDSPTELEESEQDWECGVAWHPPYHTDPSLASALPLRCRLPLGTSTRSGSASWDTLRLMARLDWPHSAYNLVEHNCHDWAAAAAKALGVEAPPPWLNRAAHVLGFISGASDSTKMHLQQTHRDLESPADPSVSVWSPKKTPPVLSARGSAAVLTAVRERDSQALLGGRADL
jgi:hypothetical protein